MFGSLKTGSRQTWSLFSIFAFLHCLYCPLAIGQEGNESNQGLAESSRATIAIELDLERLRESKMLEQFGELKESLIAQTYLALEDFDLFPSDIDWKAVKRMRAYIRVPDTIDQLNLLNQGEHMTADFLLQFELMPSEMNDQFLERVESVSKQQTVGGKTYLRPSQADSMEDRFALYNSNNNYVEIGTDRFVIRDENTELTTQDLSTHLKDSSPKFFRFTMDMTRNPFRRAVVQQVVRELYLDEPLPEYVLSVLQDSKTVDFVVDPDSDEVFSLASVTESSESKTNVGRQFEAITKFIADSLESEQAEDLPSTEQQLSRNWTTILDKVEIENLEDGVRIALKPVDEVQVSVRNLLALAKLYQIQLEQQQRLFSVILAFHNFADAYGKFPAADLEGMSRNLSWRVKLLPYLQYGMEDDELEPLDGHYQLAESWDHETNSALKGKMPSVFGDGGSHSQIVQVNWDPQPDSFDDIQDGTMHTAAFVLLPDGLTGVPWEQPVDYSPQQLIQLLKGLAPEQYFLVAAYDGEIHRIDQGFDPDRFMLLMNPSDGLQAFFPGDEYMFDPEYQNTEEMFEDESFEPEPPPEVEFENKLESAQQLFERQNYIPASALADDILQTEPLNVQALEIRGMSYAEIGRFHESIRDLSAVISLKEDLSRIWVTRGHCWMQLGELAKAISDFDRSIELDRGDYLTNALIRRGYCYMLGDQMDQAMDDFESALKVDPENIYAIEQISFLALGSGEYKKAIDGYSRSLEIQPENSFTLSQLALILAACPEDSLRDGERAVEMAKQACEMTSWNEGWMIGNLAAAHAEAGDYAKAREYSLMALEKSSDPSDIQLLEERLELYKADQPARLK